MKPLYILEKWTHGWLIVAPSGGWGVPCDCLSEVLPLVPKGAITDIGIASYFKRSFDKPVCFCIGSPSELDIWRTEIEQSLAPLSPDERWWKGLDVGHSAAAIFSVLSPRYRIRAREFSGGSIPSDASDFERCKRLLGLFPEWHARLDEVGRAFPETKWPQLVERWDELSSLSPEDLTAKLRACSREVKRSVVEPK